MFSLLKERRLPWLGHVRRMKDSRLPKDIHYSKLAAGSRAISRLFLRLKDLCKRDFKTWGLDIANWEVLCTDRSKRRKAVKKSALKSEILRKKCGQKDVKNRRRKIIQIKKTTSQD